MANNLALLNTWSSLRKHAITYSIKITLKKVKKKLKNWNHPPYAYNNCNEELTHDLCLQEYVRLPSKYEPFINNKTEWISDKYFTQQRLAGNNPLSIQRVTIHKQGRTVS